MRIGQVVNENGNSVVYPTSAYQTDVIANISVNWLRNTWERGKKPCATLGLCPPALGCRCANLLGRCAAVLACHQPPAPSLCGPPVSEHVALASA